MASSLTAKVERRDPLGNIAMMILKNVLSTASPSEFKRSSTMKTFPRYPRLAHIHSPRIRRIGIAVAVLVAAAGTAFACSDSGPSEPPDLSGTFFGPVTVVASGSGRAYVILDASGAPTNLGVALTASAMANLPNDAAEYVFALPSQAGSTPFKHAAINWAPQGHPPPMIYTVPHFDFHFYTITQAARDAILLGDSALAAKMARQPAGAYVPDGYVTGMSAAQMGMHWNDPTAPERHGEPFTATFIYGSYDGAFIFAEPMVTKAFLETKPATLVVPVKLPAQYATTGYHPTSYTVSYDATTKEYRVALSGLIRR
jgi:hypothetical protein